MKYYAGCDFRLWKEHLIEKEQKRVHWLKASINKKYSGGEADVI